MTHPDTLNWSELAIRLAAAKRFAKRLAAAQHNEDWADEATEIAADLDEAAKTAVRIAQQEMGR